MSLWGTSTSDRSKPKWLKVGGRFDPKNCYATAKGWVFKNTNGKEEILVALGGLSTALGGAQITEVFFDKAVYAVGDVASISLVFSEKVTNTSGSPTISVTTVGAGALTFTYVSGSGTDTLVFTHSLSDTDIAGEGLPLVGQTVSGSTWADSAGGSDTVDTAFVTGDQKGANGSGTYVDPTVKGASIKAVGFGAASYVHTATVHVQVKYNVNVFVTGTPLLSLNEVTVSASNMSYLSGSGTNTLVFSLDLTIAGFGQTGKTIQILAQTLTMTSATITTADGTAAEVVFVSGDRTDSALTGAYADIVLS